MSNWGQFDTTQFRKKKKKNQSFFFCSLIRFETENHEKNERTKKDNIFHQIHTTSALWYQRNACCWNGTIALRNGFVWGSFVFKFQLILLSINLNLFVDFVRGLPCHVIEFGIVHFIWSVLIKRAYCSESFLIPLYFRRVFVGGFSGEARLVFFWISLILFRIGGSSMWSNRIKWRSWSLMNIATLTNFYKSKPTEFIERHLMHKT